MPVESGTNSAGSRRVIVEVRYGPAAAQKGIIEPGSTLRVGRREDADIPILSDEHLSAAHFEITWDGTTCTLLDLGSFNGTLLGGERVTSAKLSHGDWIRAGSTDFSVFFEARTPPRPAQLSTLPLSAREQALAELREAMGNAPLYAILDAARSERIPILLQESVDEVRSLYDGVAVDTLAHVAPYLVRFRQDSGLLSRVVLEGWGNAWGIYFTCKRRLKDIRAHFRKIVMVTMEEGDPEPVYFRFYDPRVMESFLPLCTPRQEDDIFGEIDRFYFESSDGRLVTAVRSPRSAGSRR